MKYNIAYQDGDPSSVTAFHQGQTFVVGPDHPNFQRIIELGPEVGDDEKAVAKFLELFQVGKSVAGKFADSVYSDRVMFVDGQLLLDGDPVENAIGKTIVSFYTEGNDDFRPLIAFMEKLETNPNKHSVEHLFRWMEKWHFGIAPDGDIIAYKGIRSDDMSATAGGAFVNGKWIAGHVPNQPNTVISMARSKVTFDPRNGCSVGLHVGNWGYASTFSQKCVRVKVNPRDVVSVPTDSSDQKMRVCQYMVLETVKSQDQDVLYIDAAVQKMSRYVDAKEAGKETVVVPEGALNVERHWDGLPVRYEFFTAEEFDKLPVTELRAVAKTFGIAGISRMSKPTLIDFLVDAQPERLATWPADDPERPENRA